VAGLQPVRLSPSGKETQKKKRETENEKEQEQEPSNSNTSPAPALSESPTDNTLDTQKTQKILDNQDIPVAQETQETHVSDMSASTLISMWKRDSDVENIDVTALVRTHADYAHALPLILPLVRLEE
jgi:mRNA deadenylase 3'-5' endonuclease subunit Ccr4